MSSSVGSWYISLFRALFSACGSMQILRSPFFLRATMTLLTQSVGSSTCAITFIVCSLLSSIFRGSRRATGTRRVAATTGITQLSILKCATPGNVPSPSPKTSPKLVYQYEEDILSTESHFIQMVSSKIKWQEHIEQYIEACLLTSPRTSSTTTSDKDQ